MSQRSDKGKKDNKNRSVQYNKRRFFSELEYVWSGLHKSDNTVWMAALAVFRIRGVHSIVERFLIRN
jgi:hypothetical protein